MSYNPDISAARREAKRHARETGTSYQVALEEIARRTGSASWSEFLKQPQPLPGHIHLEGPSTKALEAEPAGHAASDADQETNGRRRIWISAILCALLAAGIWLCWNSWEASARIQGLNAVYNDQRALAAKIPVPEIATDRDPYVMAWPLPDGGRRLHFIYFDWRPLARGFGYSIVSRIRTALGYEIVYVPQAREHPVFRFQGDLDCRTGRLDMVGAYVADDFVNPAKEQISYKRNARTLPAQRVAALCAQDVVERTHRVEKSTRETGSVIE